MSNIAINLIGGSRRQVMAHDQWNLIKNPKDAYRPNGDGLVEAEVPFLDAVIDAYRDVLLLQQDEAAFLANQKVVQERSPATPPFSWLFPKGTRANPYPK